MLYPALRKLYKDDDDALQAALQDKDVYKRQAAGFFCYPLGGFSGEDRAAKILDFRDGLEAAVMDAAGEDAVTFLGGASGLYCGYLDFIAWDLDSVLTAASEFFRKSGLEWANFHSFRRDVGYDLLLKY